MTPNYRRRVSPFGNPRIIACLPAPRGVSQAPASFIASCCQGIHRMPFVAFYTSPNDAAHATTSGNLLRSWSLSTIVEIDAASTITLLQFQRTYGLVEAIGLEPMTSCVQSRCSPS